MLLKRSLELLEPRTGSGEAFRPECPVLGRVKGLFPRRLPEPVRLQVGLNRVLRWSWSLEPVCLGRRLELTKLRAGLKRGLRLPRPCWLVMLSEWVCPLLRETVKPQAGSRRGLCLQHWLTKPQAEWLGWERRLLPRPFPSQACAGPLLARPDLPFLPPCRCLWASRLSISRRPRRKLSRTLRGSTNWAEATPTPLIARMHEAMISSATRILVSRHDALAPTPEFDGRQQRGSGILAITPLCPSCSAADNRSESKAMDRVRPVSLGLQYLSYSLQSCADSQAQVDSGTHEWYTRRVYADPESLFRIGVFALGAESSSGRQGLHKGLIYKGVLSRSREPSAFE